MKYIITMTSDEIAAVIAAMFRYNGHAEPDVIEFISDSGSAVEINGARITIPAPDMIVRDQPDGDTKPLTPREIVAAYSGRLDPNADPQ